MKVGVLLLNFGEPADPAPQAVEAYLERIFLQNASLDGPAGAAEAERARARSLAAARAPGLVETYREIGGSPLGAQAEAQARALAAELDARGADASVHTGFQFTEPSIEDAVASAREAGARALAALPVYPLCGRSTTVAALDDVERALEALAWRPPLVSVTGWHVHPAYLALRAEHVRAFVESRGLDLADPDTLLYFSAHGTPLAYLDETSRYDRYVAEHCAHLAGRLGADRWAVGFQNHSNRGIPWTRPDNDDRVREVVERRLVVVPVSFMHEQSETLAELDLDLRAVLDELGKELHRVPVPHDHAGFPTLLADLLTGAVTRGVGGAKNGVPATTGSRAAASVSAAWGAPSAASPTGGLLAPCRCHPRPGAWCTNGRRDLPPSPYGPGASPPP